MEKFDRDFSRQNHAKGLGKTLAVILHSRLLALWFCRKAEVSGHITSIICHRVSSWLFKKNGLEIGPTDQIGGGLVLVHAWNITINHRCTIGKDFTIFKGATIGSIRSGKKEGVPKIGDRVTVCANAMVCGNITIGDDVLIAANAFVNFNVPSNSIVIGNPGVIFHKENPSADYLC